MATQISTISHMAKSKKPVGRPPKDTDVLVTVSANVEPRVVSILDELRLPAKRTRSQQIALIIEDWLMGKGLWPPAESKR